MAFTPLFFSKIDGLGVYPAEPIVEDSYDRGSLKGKRVETVTYVFEREGSFEIPEIAIWWWDLGRKALRKVVLSSLRATVSGGPANADDLTIDDAVEGSGQTGIQMLLGALSACYYWRGLPGGSDRRCSPVGRHGNMRASSQRKRIFIVWVPPAAKTMRRRPTISSWTG